MKKIIFISLLAVGALSGTGSALADVSATALEFPLSADMGAYGIGMAGLLVNRASLDRLFTGLKTIFNNALTAETGTWQDTAMEVASTSAEEDYAWLSRFPMMRKWVGEKHTKALEAHKYTAKNEDWEATVSVRRNDIEDESLGIYNTQAQMAGGSAAELHDIIVDSLKNDAFVSNGIDGQFFYDTDHEVDGASVSNKGTKKLSVATPAAALASYGAARTAIMTYKDEEGMPLRLIPNVLEVPPALEAIGKTLLTADKLNDNSPNPYKGTATLKVNPGLTDPDAWFLHCTSKPVKPFIVQMRKRPVFVSQTNMEADDVFMKGEYKYGAEARATGVYAFWQLSYGSDGTVA